MDIRVGQGFDIHAFAEGRPCIIGGVAIPHHSGPVGHSDADPLLHAIIDALLGAAGLGDIGTHFPDSDPAWKGADSAALLSHVMGLLAGQGWRVLNVDASVLTEAPKLAPHRAAIEARIAALTGISPDRVNVKGKTHETFDAVGQGRAIAVHCCILITRGESA